MTVTGMPVIPAARGRHSRIIFRLCAHPAGINSIHGQSGFTNARVSPARPGLARRAEAAAAAGIYRRRRGAIRPDGRRTGGAGRGGARRALSRAGAAAPGCRVQPRALAVRQRERRGGRRPGGVRARAALRRCVPRRQCAAVAADDRASHLVHRVAPAHSRARGRGARRARQPGFARRLASGGGGPARAAAARRGRPARERGARETAGRISGSARAA
ncbi:hypothetical protein BST28156_05669 [Burkholderia stagnalis]|nr:hypothetical protein BST28156_05669 [Burkholderia stagnalis]